VIFSRRIAWGCVSGLAALMVVACSHGTASSNPGNAASGPAAAPNSRNVPGAQVTQIPAAPPASETGGFDGAKAFAHVAQLVAIGPRSAGSEGIHRAQDYIRTQLQSFGCTIEEDDFHASTPVGDVAMKNIVAKITGQGPGVILLLTHYDTLRKADFVGAVDGGSGTGLMLEIARLLCGKKQASNAVWIAFLDAEEAFVNWNADNDNTYGSRELAAKLALSGDLKRVKAVILADMIGAKNLKIRKEGNSTKWLMDLVWKTAARLGYKDVFLPAEITPIEDDHLPFIHRGIPTVDLIDFTDFQEYWHTTQDTLDKVSPQSLAIVGHVILESVAELQKKFH
jgi:glutaminyl-peptide cyclotransferase